MAAVWFQSRNWPRVVFCLHETDPEPFRNFQKWICKKAVPELFVDPLQNRSHVNRPGQGTNHLEPVSCKLQVSLLDIKFSHS